jgi:hypothetical protein
MRDHQEHSEAGTFAMRPAQQIRAGLRCRRNPAISIFRAFEGSRISACSCIGTISPSDSPNVYRRETAPSHQGIRSPGFVEVDLALCKGEVD